MLSAEKYLLCVVLLSPGHATFRASQYFSYQYVDDFPITTISTCALVSLEPSAYVIRKRLIWISRPFVFCLFGVLNALGHHVSITKSVANQLTHNPYTPQSCCSSRMAIALHHGTHASLAVDTVSRYRNTAGKACGSCAPQCNRVWVMQSHHVSMRGLDVMWRCAACQTRPLAAVPCVPFSCP